MIKKVGIIDYGAGNLKSISKALKIFDLESEVIDVLSLKCSDLERRFNFSIYDLVILPGVGEFGSAMEVLGKISDKIVSHIKSGRPLLGICLGLQLLFEKSEESFGKKGLSIIPGKVIKFRFDKKICINHKFKLKIPHMCWNKVQFVEPKENFSKRYLILNNLSQEEFFYFVHSYYVIPNDEDIIFGTTVYGKKFCSMIVKDNIVATQFHLEKSADKGLVLLKNIIRYFEKL